MIVMEQVIKQQWTINIEYDGCPLTIEHFDYIDGWHYVYMIEHNTVNDITSKIMLILL